MGCNTSKESMQAVENNAKGNAENVKEKLQTEGETILNNVTEKKLEAEENGKNYVEDDLIDIDLEDPEVTEAATKIQAAFRGHQTRKTMKQEDAEPTQNLEEEFSPDDKELCEAATKIQASFRGHLARKTVPRKGEEEELSKELEKLDAKAPEEEEEEDLDIDLNDPELQQAATKIQASFRGHRVRKEKTTGSRDQ